MPAASAGVEIISGERRNDYARFGDTARVRSGALVAELSGRWVKEGSQDIHLRLANSGTEAMQMPTSALALVHHGERVTVSTISDVTGVDAADEDASNDEPASVFNEFAAVTPLPALTVPGGGKRQFLLSFGNFQRPQNQMKKGSRVTAELPLPQTGSVRVEFVAD